MEPAPPEDMLECVKEYLQFHGLRDTAATLSREVNDRDGGLEDVSGPCENPVFRRVAVQRYRRSCVFFVFW